MAQSAGEIVKAYIKAINSRDMNNAVPYLHPDVVFDNVPQKGDARLTHGPEAIRKRLQHLLDFCEKSEWEIVRQIEQGDTVFNERVDRFWFKPGTFPKSDLLEWPVATRWELEDGKIILWRDYYELELTEPQLGVSLADFGKKLGEFYGA
jgi:limonene-1,2-epoxide hydrolase